MPSTLPPRILPTSAIPRPSANASSSSSHSGAVSASASASQIGVSSTQLSLEAMNVKRDYPPSASRFTGISSFIPALRDHVEMRRGLGFFGLGITTFLLALTAPWGVACAAAGTLGIAVTFLALRRMSPQRPEFELLFKAHEAFGSLAAELRRGFGKSGKALQDPVYRKGRAQAEDLMKKLRAAPLENFTAVSAKSREEFFEQPSWVSESLWLYEDLSRELSRLEATDPLLVEGLVALLVRALKANLRLRSEVLKAEISFCFLDLVSRVLARKDARLNAALIEVFQNRDIMVALGLEGDFLGLRSFILEVRSRLGIGAARKSQALEKKAEHS